MSILGLGKQQPPLKTKDCPECEGRRKNPHHARRLPVCAEGQGLSAYVQSHRAADEPAL